MTPRHLVIVLFLLLKYSCTLVSQHEADFTREGCEYLNLEGTNYYRQSLENCKNLCASSDWCKAINYFRKEQKCSLLRTNSGQGVTTGTRSCVNIVRNKIGNATQHVCGKDENCAETNECLPFGPLFNATIMGNMHFVGSTQRIKCNEDFLEITGSDRTECLNTGNWSHYPKCIYVHCGEPQTDDNATLSTGGTVNGSVRTYTCGNGFGVNGSRSEITYTISCFHGSWQCDTAKCSGMNCDDTQLTNAEFAAGDSFHGTSRAFTCNAGFSIDRNAGNITGEAVCFEGRWRMEICSAISPTLGKPCSSSTECIETESVCSWNRCFCSPLFKYNNTMRNCVKVCFEIKDTFTTYPSLAIGGYNMATIPHPNDCHSACLLDPSCLSYEKHQDHGRKCFLSNVSIVMIKDAHPGAINPHASALFSRDCE